MGVLLGDKGRFAVEVGEWTDSLRRVDLWVADHWLTCDDNAAYVEQFRPAVRDTALQVRSGHGWPLPFAGLSPAATHRRFVAATGNDTEDELLRERFWIFDGWGPTTDNLLAYLFRDGDQLVITVQFWRDEHLRNHPEHAGTVFAVEIEAAEFAGILEDLVIVLDPGKRPPAIK
ncbi:hypothetical protein OG552_18175 [Streptomyces sp. NBC_01476]|uniref:hypothetical protein n=1 Tax=Streptomyces sp. NBC_01476 TaxID=2903881 RepID=UPI002E346B4A|nr:hypothetical protein [Streptomyces sp. NBC_01476]